MDRDPSPWPPTGTSRAPADRATRVTVVMALVADLVIAVAKAVAGVLAPSPALLAEAAHSIADSINQVFLLASLSRSRRRAGSRHPFGYGKERFFWSLLAAVGIFVTGGCFSFYQGVHTWLAPPVRPDPGCRQAVSFGSTGGPEELACDVKPGQLDGGGLLVAGGDASPLFQAVGAPLDYRFPLEPSSSSAGLWAGSSKATSMCCSGRRSSWRVTDSRTLWSLSVSGGWTRLRGHSRRARTTFVSAA
ncbi:cation transporter [Streptomyces sp. CB01881]|uniref:cation diffusion facilitator family transporter n=1 Tax=Streptomyces sp. CB01881 TaxID=2078691 RepID=UPI000CDBF631|nr:cation transporter [Streptomyces sp. CB01881]AUY53888.1 hypothetical protein C2142_01830 [Streptomyces sp. CB01881]TYC77760.1 cation transporter [Streptomyces sp. CB01881]